MRDSRGKSSDEKNTTVQAKPAKPAKPKKTMHLRKEKDNAQGTNSINSSTSANRPTSKRKLSTNIGAIASEETMLSTILATNKPPKETKASLNQPILGPTRKCHPSRRASENSRISKDIANKKQAAAEKRQRRASSKTKSQAAEAALFTKQASQRNKRR